jgi:MFS family permease
VGRATDALTPTRQRSVAFAALGHKDFRGYFSTGVLSMMADNIEHVISYWVIFQAFHSPMLAGFAVISHWAPFLLFGVHVGALTDRHDCRKIIQGAQIAAIGLSLAWGLLFLTGSLQMWHAMLLLVVHGFVGTFAAPATQVIIHDMVGGEHLQSAIRLNATGRQIGLLLGPAVGGGMLLVLGPAYGLMANVAFHIPLLVWLAGTRYTGHLREGVSVSEAPKIGAGEALRVLREVAGNRTVIVMVALAGLSSFLVGTAYQPQMPQFARDLGADSRGVLYTMLLAAHGAGAVIGGLALESASFLQARARTTVLLAALWCIAIGGFAAAPHYPIALVALFLAGGLSLAFGAMAQTLVQLEASPQQRGRVIGLFNMAQQGLRVGSGVTVGMLGAWIGIHWSLGLSVVVLLVITLALFAALGSRRELLSRHA